MKKIFILALAFTFSFQLFGQKLTLSNKWKVKKWGITVGQDQDMLPNIGADYFLSTAKNLDEAKYEGLNVQPRDLYGMTCENPNLRIELTLLPPGMKNTELNVAIAGMFNRVDGAHYHSGDWNDADYQHISFNSYTHEAALEATLRKRLNVLRIFNLYGGAGTNLGLSFAGNMWVNGQIPVDNNGNLGSLGSDSGANNMSMQDISDSYDMKNSLHQRVFLHGGLGILFFKRVELGIEGRYGIGYRYFGGDNINHSVLNSAALTLRYVMR